MVLLLKGSVAPDNIRLFLALFVYYVRTLILRRNFVPKVKSKVSLAGQPLCYSRSYKRLACDTTEPKFLSTEKVLDVLFYECRSSLA